MRDYERDTFFDFIDELFEFLTPYFLLFFWAFMIAQAVRAYS